MKIAGPDVQKAAGPTQLCAGHEILSQEGTTQGCPLAMAMYALALVPLLGRLRTTCKQAWFADDGTGGGSLKELKGWWEAIAEHGPDYGYFPKAAKTILKALIDAGA